MRCFYFQDLSLNVYSYLDFFRYCRNSSFEKHWWYRHAALPRDIGSKIYIPHLLWSIMDWKKGSLKRIKILFPTLLEVWQKNTCGGAAFLETLLTAIISLHKKVDFPRNKVDLQNADIFRNIIFLCDTIDLKQSLESILKTALNEVHFIVNIYSFLPLDLQANPSFPKASHLPLSQEEQL